MTLINHEVLKEGYYFMTPKDCIAFIDKNNNKIAKKLIKKGYKELTREQLDSRLVAFVERFCNSLKQVSITKVDSNEPISDILRLWYKDGFCHYKTFKNGTVGAGTVSGNITVDTCDEDVNMYPTILMFEDYGFGGDLYEQKIYDKDLEKLYSMYGLKV